MAGHTFEGLTGEDLLHRLKNMSPEERALPICFSYDYGDHGHTTVTPVAQDVNLGKIRYSDYHRMPKSMEDEEGSDDYETAQEAIIIS